MLSSVLFALALQQSEIDKVLEAPALQGALTGVCVTTLDGKSVYGRLEDLRLVPASNQKLLTAAFAASTLGMDYRPKTRFWKEGGRVYVDSTGDPTITREALLEAKKALGLGSDLAIYVRQSFRPVTPPSWEWDDLPHRYGARVTAFSFDRGGFEIWANGSKLLPLDPALRITLRHVLGDGPPEVEYRPDLRLAVVTGKLPESRTMIEAFAIPDPDAAAARLLGGTIVHTESAPPDRKPDYEIQGPPLRAILKECLEKSDNSFAEHLFFMAAASASPLKRPEYPDAAKRLREFLEGTVGIPAGGVSPVDGSGMSRHNMVSPAAVCRLLLWAYRQPWSADFIACLAAPGEGTLASRLRTSTFVGKTGSLDAVTCLSGYVKTASGRTLAVSLLFNHTMAPASEVRALQDRLVAILERG